MKLSNTFKSTVAVLFTAAGLVSIASVPSSAAAKVSCYELSKTTDVLTTKTATKCPSGYTKGTPSATLLQGTNNTGDIDLYHGTGVGTLAINGSSFDGSLVTATTSGSGDFNGVAFSSYPANGSGSGRSGIEAGTLNIGFSDQPISAAAGTLATTGTVANTTAEVQSNFIQVPYLLGGAVVAYNLGNGFDNLKLTASEIAQIYNGAITTWSNPQIVATNGGAKTAIGIALTKLGTSGSAENTIKVCYRNASSGTTYAFTDYLHQAAGTTQVASGNAMEGTGNAWTATNVVGESNNAAMASTLATTPGAIGYVEYSYLLVPGNAKIQGAELQDHDGVWLNPNVSTPTMLGYIANAAAAAGSNITSENFSIVNEAGKNVWPLATYSWAIVAKSQSSSISAAAGNPSAAEAVVKYLDWETHYAQVADASNNGYVPLPAAAAAYARSLLGQVQYNTTELLTATSSTTF